MPIDFTATECGIDNGMGGASNAATTDDPHYILFGKDGDGIYFEYDDQIHGGINQVAHLVVHVDRVVFALVNGETITVHKLIDDTKWPEFLAGMRDVFAPAIVSWA